MLPHYVPNAGIRLTAPDVTVAYTGDTGPDDALAALGADADLFIVEATGQAKGIGVLREPTQPRYHLRASDAGLWARRAGGASADADAFLARHRPDRLAARGLGALRQ